MRYLPEMAINYDSSDLPVGAVLRRQYLGTMYEVTVEAGLTTMPRAAERGWWRYRYKGRLWKTLSAIAYDITGNRYMSGNRFFRLRSRRGKCRKQISWKLP